MKGCSTGDRQAFKGEVSSIPVTCKFQWKLSLRGSSSFTLETPPGSSVPGAGAEAGPAVAR